MIIETMSEYDTRQLGERIGELLRGGEIIELVGDVGAGKTAFVKGLALGLQVDEDIQSPSFTINRTYETPSHLRLVHYDFYRLEEAGILADELRDVLYDSQTIVVIEWADIITDVLPEDRLTIHISSLADNSRRLEFNAGGERSQALLREVEH
jgi:tRNA threonylcarbamoyladenosine biosynthesis protein TsaE